MVNLKNITELPVAESAEGLNLIVNDNGAAKQIAASAVGAQADWAETNENSPAFIKNKPIEEVDLDLTVNVTYDENNDGLMHAFTVNKEYNYITLKNKIINGMIPNTKIIWTEQMNGSVNNPSTNVVIYPLMQTIPAALMGEGSPEGIMVHMQGLDYMLLILLTEDGSVFDLNSI